ncbi:hypothetical protein E2542_SST30585 [Spatholobus suberectus]|nr:hypothetical protein E2542_SST30585 [Spatholobus suberectus]
MSDTILLSTFIFMATPKCVIPPTKAIHCHPRFIKAMHSPLRKARANVVSIVAKYAVPSGEWPDLLPFLFQCSQSVQEDHRQICMLFYSSACRMRLAAGLELLPSIGSFLEFTHDGDEVTCPSLLMQLHCFLREQSACQQIESGSEIDDDDDSTHDQQPYSPPQDRAMVVACLAEVPQIPQNMGSPIASYVDLFL